MDQLENFLKYGDQDCGFFEIKRLNVSILK